MTDQQKKTRTSVFISYAWGSSFEEKEWLRHSIVRGLNLFDLSVFWDRDEDMTIHGPLETIKSALDARPLTVIFICDEFYLAQAKRPGSGLAKEIRLLKEIESDAQVKFIPLITENIDPNKLPTLLKGRFRIDLSNLPKDGGSFSNILISAIHGDSITEIEQQKKRYLADYELRKKISAYVQQNPWDLIGTQKEGVFINNVPLRPAEWMRHSHLSSRMEEDSYGGGIRICPEEGYWAWHRASAASTGMKALGTAIMSFWFPHNISEADQSKLEYCGLLIAEHFIRHVEEWEVLHIRADEIIPVLFSSTYPDCRNAMRQLLAI